MDKRRRSRWLYPTILQRQLEVELLESRESPTDFFNAGPMSGLPADWFSKWPSEDRGREGGTEAERYGTLRNDDTEILGHKGPRFHYDSADEESHQNGGRHRSQGHRSVDVSATDGSDHDPAFERPWHVFALPFQDQDSQKQDSGGGGGGGGGDGIKAHHSPGLGFDMDGGNGGRGNGGGSDGGGGDGSDGSESRGNVSVDGRKQQSANNQRDGTLPASTAATEAATPAEDTALPNHQEISKTFA